MRFAINVPNFGPFADPLAVVELAQAAEAAGWDGFFLWDHVLWTNPEPLPVADPWVSLAAIAQATERIQVGPLVTPLPRRRPWQVAREAATLDALSHGRLILGVGIGGDWFGDYSGFGEPADDQTHGAQLDEALAVITGLWSGEPFSYTGNHYTVRDVQFLPRPVQQPRIPIWVAGVWPGTRPFRRAARFDGVVPLARPEGATLSPDDVRAMLGFIGQHREDSTPIDVVLGGPPLSVSQLAAYADAGVTWYQDGFLWQDSPQVVLEHIRRGPPRLA
jgi:alkanesulfonate monooxygenase SsuD/methylene tetrahydromethanopterin reductase-like flavin-dependent oxidoreductase (luciferase family)